MRYYNIKKLYEVGEKIKSSNEVYTLVAGLSNNAKFSSNRASDPDLTRQERTQLNLDELRLYASFEGLENLIKLYDKVLEQSKHKFYYRVIYTEMIQFYEILPKSLKAKFWVILDKHKVDFTTHEYMFLFKKNRNGQYFYHCNEMQKGNQCICGQKNKFRRYERKARLVRDKS